MGRDAIMLSKVEMLLEHQIKNWSYRNWYLCRQADRVLFKSVANKFNPIEF
jgi:hypothetical protein